jgi:hypothetical protein
MQANLAGVTYGEQMNFTVFVRITPNLAYGRRFEYVRDMEKIANAVEDDLNNIAADSHGMEIVVPGPVMFTPQFGQNTARLTFSGFAKSDLGVYQPLTDRTVDHQNETKTGPSATGGTFRNGVNSTANQDADVRNLKSALESASTYLVGNIIRIELNGLVYGDGGRSFPRP